MSDDRQGIQLRLLTADELRAYADDASAFAVGIGCLPVDPHPDWFAAILRRGARNAAADPDNLRWLSFYAMVDVAAGALVGSIDFKRIPVDRTVEIGYGVDLAYRNRGYATQAVRGMLALAFASGAVDRVVAATEDGNPASDRVLAKCGFTPWRTDGDLHWYQIMRTAGLPAAAEGA